MKMMKSLGAIAAMMLTWAVVTHGMVSCSSNEPSSCQSSRDCEQGYSCVSKLCRKICSDDRDCKSLGVTCISGLCGGNVKPDGGDTDEPPKGECTPGEKRSCYDGPSGTKNVGLCQEGKQTCSTDGKWGKCEGEVQPAAELCDNKDNDCDGNVDNNCGTSCSAGQTRECYTGAQGTKDVGPCKAGQETCQADGTWSQCEGQVLPVPENCNTPGDDDCDGKPNQGCECKPGQTEDCKANNGCAGIRTCQRKPGGGGTEWSECLATKPYDEKCDQLDNDCDGKTDNVKGSDSPLTRECNNEPCKEKGVETCVSGLWKNCTGKKPDLEVCDGKDNDCDGRVDNIENKDTPLVKACIAKDKNGNPAKGVCRDGQMFCKDGKFDEATCKGAEPRAEECNGFDDDCDGIDDLKETDNMCGDGNECIKDTLGTIKCVPK